MKKIRKFKSNRCGFTLAEVLLASALLAIAVAGAVLPFAGAASVQAEGIHMTVAAGLADDLMQRIASENFDDIVDNYNGYSESAGSITDASGTVIDDAGYDGYSRSVSCQAVHLDPQTGTDDPFFIDASVSVSYNSKELITIRKIISK